MGRSRFAVAGAVLALLAAGLPAVSAPASATAAPADWPTYHGSANRAGYAADMPPAGTVRVATQRTLDGAVYASPLVIGGTTIVATENNSVYAIGSDQHVLWRRRLPAPSPGSERPCGDIDPLGITGTPIYNAANNTLYVAAELGGPPRHKLYALNFATGAVRWSRTLDLPGVDASAMQERGALNITGGRVWVPFGGLAGDCGNYKGRVIGYALGGSGSLVSYTVPTEREAGIWSTPGPVVAGSNSLFVSVGNGAAGVGDPYDGSDSVLNLNASAQRTDFFAPSNWAQENDADQDLGSQGPALVGSRWVFIAGKSGSAYVLRRSALGGIGGQVSTMSLCLSFGGTAVVGSTVYVPCTDGVRAVRIDSGGVMHVLWHASSSCTGSPVVGGGRVWTLNPGGGSLCSLNKNTGALVTSVAVGTTSRFATPSIYGRTLTVPTLQGITVVSTS
jgi:hypothetical protein